MYTYHRHNEEASLSIADQAKDIVDYAQEAGAIKEYSEGDFAKRLGIDDGVVSCIFPVE